MNTLAILGYIMLILLVILLLKGKSTAATVFILLPLVVAVIAGYDLDTINEAVKAGVKTTNTIAVMSPFAVLFFGVMTEAGLFDPIINMLVKRIGRSAVGICVVVCLVTIVGHMDESATTTIMVTVPFFLPVFKKLKLDPRDLLLIAGLTMGVMNLLPWGGPMLRVSAVTGLDPSYLWLRLLPIQILGLILCVGVSVYIGLKAKKAGADALAKTAIEEIKASEQKPITWKFWFNLVLTIACLGILSWGKIASYAVFMVGAAIGLLVNFRGQKEQAAVIRKGANAGFFVIVTILAASVFVGILSYGEPSMVTYMAKLLLGILPAPMAKHLHIIMGFLSVPLGMVFSNDTYLYGVLPLCMEVGASAGVTTEAIAITMAVGRNVATMLSPVYAPMYLLIGMGGVELKDHVKHCFLTMWVLSIILIVFGAVIGIYPL